MRVPQQLKSHWVPHLIDRSTPLNNRMLPTPPPSTLKSSPCLQRVAVAASRLSWLHAPLRAFVRASSLVSPVPVPDPSPLGELRFPSLDGTRVSVTSHCHVVRESPALSQQLKVSTIAKANTGKYLIDIVLVLVKNYEKTPRILFRLSSFSGPLANIMGAALDSLPFGIEIQSSKLDVNLIGEPFFVSKAVATVFESFESTVDASIWVVADLRLRSYF